jgi:hypothetical protein
MPLEGFKKLASSDVPEAYLLVFPTTGQEFPVRAKRDRACPVGSFVEHPEAFTGVNLPGTNGSILIRAG